VAVLAREEDYAQLERCVKAGISVNENVSFAFRDWRPTPLYMVTIYSVRSLMDDHVKMLRTLVSYGADPNNMDGDRSTPLVNQCYNKGKYETMKALLELGADPNRESTEGDFTLKSLNFFLTPDDYNQETFEFTPITEEPAERIALLLEYGADVNAPYPIGETPLTLVLVWGAGDVRQRLVTLFLNKGADMNAALAGLEKAAEIAPVYYDTLYKLYNEGEFVPQDKEKANEYWQKKLSKENKDE
jgi:ankyrin repeat protein